MSLNEKQYLAIEWILEGRQIALIAKNLGVARQTVYNWLNSEEFKSELDTLRLDIQNSTKEHVRNKINLYVDELEELALNKETSVKVRADVLKYMINRVWGNTTTKVEVSENDTDDEEKIDLDALTEELKSLKKDE